jgi:Ca2+-binding EF-hand superfamily protein
MHKTLIALLISGAFATVSFSALADHHEGGKPETEKQEMEADTNKDGKISFDEFKAAREKHMQEHFKHRDANGYGFIDEKEKAQAREKMKKMGKDGDRCEMHNK